MGRRVLAVTATLGTAAGLLTALGGQAGGLPPRPTPVPVVTKAQVDAAANNKAQLATLVGQLSAQVAQAQSDAQQAEGERELAEQKVALTQSKLQQAEQAQQRAHQALVKSQQDVTAEHKKFVAYLQASYMSGDVGGTAGSLLTAPDPSALIDESSLQQYQAQHHADAIGAFEQAMVGRSNAEAAEKRAVQASKIAKQNAEDALAAADAKAKTAEAVEAQKEQLQQQQQTLLNQASLQLATLNNKRESYLNYLHQQAVYQAAVKARQEAIARARALAAEQARERARSHSGGGGSGGGGGGSSGGGSFNPGPSAPSGGSWTAAKGQRAANRALSQLGTPYAWAGGGAYGPSRGVCDASNGAPNDCYVTGYDCSGLAMYAWGQNWDHYAATQYTEAGRYHPSSGDLRPGDLIFWSSNGTIGGIHHVAIYIGNGRIVEAPYSGGYVQTASVWEYGSFFGATRPLS